MENQATKAKGRVAKPSAEKPKAQIQKENIPIKNNKEGLNTLVPVVNVASATVAAPIAKEQNDIKEAPQDTSVSAKEMLDAQYPTPANNNFDVNDYPIAGPGKPAAEEVVVPKTPAEDPSFKALTSSINANAKKQRKHEPAQSASKKAQKAAAVPSNERLSKAQASQVEVMEQQETGEFKASDFKEQLKSRIAEMELPKDEEAADKFKENNNLSEVKSAAMGDVKTAQDNASGGIPEATSAAPNTASVPVMAVSPMPKAMPGKKPAMIPTAQAMPSKRSEVSVEKPLQEETTSLDTQMEQHGVTDTMLANSNEASFKSALDEKNTAKAQSKASVTSFRNTENQELNTAQQQSQQQVNATSQGMHTNRVAAFNKVAGNQKQSATQNTAARKQVADKIQGLYTETKTKVTSILSALDTAVASKFESGARAAQRAFENHIETNMKAYKEKRYGSSIFSWKQLRRVKDAFVGLPKEVNQFFESGRKIYIDTMDGYLGYIATLVANELNKAKRTIKEGKKSVQDYVDGLSPDLRKIGQQAASEIQSKFDSLEQDIDNKKDTLIDVLSQKYSEAVASVDTQIEALKEKNSGLINKAMGALKGVFDIIIKVKNTLTNLLANVVTAVGAIISDPIGFFKMLITGVGQGVQNFMTNIVQHLQSGLLGWLTGAMGSLSIQMPENIFSLKGIFSLTTQILGFTWSTIRTVGVKVVGEPIVKALETGFEMVQILREKGIAGLWEHLKEQFQDLKETVIGAIKDMLMSQVVQAGIKWILGLLSPVGAFVKAIMAIIDVVKFFIQRASQIAELVSAFTESIAAIAAGKVGAVAKSIENALGKAVPVVIGLLASVLGIGGLANKVLGIVRKIRKRVEKALFSLWTKIKNAGRKVWRKLSRKKGSSRKIKEDNKKQKPAKITAKDRAKHKKIASKIKAKLSAKSNKKTKDFKEFYEIKTKEAKKLEDKYQPKLKKGINLDITSGTLSQERKDNDIDFNIKIYPNTTQDKAEVIYEDGKTIDDVSLVNELEKLPAKSSFDDVKKIAPHLNEIVKENKLNYEFTRIKLKGSSNKDNYTIEIKEVIKTQNSTDKRKKDVVESKVGIIKIAREFKGSDGSGGAPDINQFLINAKNEFSDGSKDTIINEAEKLHEKITKEDKKSKIDDLVAYVKDLDDLSALLSKLSTIDEDLPDATYEFIQDSEGKAVKAEAKKLSIKTGPGTGPNANIIGWNFVTNNLNDKTNKLWVRLHLINEKKFGGRGGSTNLVPGTKNNNSDHLANFENKLKKWLDTKENNSYRVAGLEADVERYGAGQFNNEKHKHERVAIDGTLPKSEWYSNKITFTSKQFIEKSGNWVKDSKDAVAPMVLNIPLPNFDAIRVPALPTITSDQLNNIAEKYSDDPDVFNDKSVLNFLRREVFSNHDDLEEKLEDKGEDVYGINESIIDKLPKLIRQLVKPNVLTY